MTRRNYGYFRRAAFAAGCVSLWFSALTPGRADPVEDFYKGKTISLYIGTTAGGGYDVYARFVARFLGAQIPGKPVIVPRNMPGAGSRTAAGYVANVVAPDGLSLEASEQALTLEQALGDGAMQFDMAKFNWIRQPRSRRQTRPSPRGRRRGLRRSR